MYNENRKIRNQLRLLSDNLNGQIERQMEQKKTHATQGQSLSPKRQYVFQDTAVFKTHIASSYKLISNLEKEYKGIKKLDQKLMSNPDLEFQLSKQIEDMEDDIYCERARQVELLKQ